MALQDAFVLRVVSGRPAVSKKKRENLQRLVALLVRTVIFGYGPAKRQPGFSEHPLWRSCRQRRTSTCRVLLNSLVVELSVEFGSCRLLCNTRRQWRPMAFKPTRAYLRWM